MSNLPEPHVTYSDSEIAHGDPSLTHAVERVVEAGQALIVRRIDLLVEELKAHGWSLLVFAVCAFIGAGLALSGYFVALAGVINWLDDHYARSAVEIALGGLHVAAGVAIALLGKRRAAARSPS